MDLTRYRLIRARAGSVAKWTWIRVSFLKKLKANQKFEATIQGTKSKCWQVTDATIEIDGWLLPYVIESSNAIEDEYHSTNVEKHD